MGFHELRGGHRPASRHAGLRASDSIDSASWGLMRSNPEKGAEFLMQNSSPEKLSDRYSTVMNSWA